LSPTIDFLEDNEQAEYRANEVIDRVNMRPSVFRENTKISAIQNEWKLVLLFLENSKIEL
jgi:hypothetical protein